MAGRIIAIIASLYAVSITISGLGQAAEIPLTHGALREGIQSKPVGPDAEKLADRIRAWFGRENIKRTPPPKVDGLAVAWAVEAPGLAADPYVKGPGLIVRLLRVGGTDVYAGVAILPEGTASTWWYELDGKRAGGGNLEVYPVDPDSVPQSGVPKGALHPQPRWKSAIFEGTERDWWIYVPAQYKPEQPAALMVWQDGENAKNYVPPVMDNLIAKGDLPVMVNVFISPGVFADGRRNRSFEYDTLSDQYSRFLLEEILPEVEKTYQLRPDAQSRAIAGISSGGICAWTAAWERPDRFSKVLSWVGSFTGIAARLGPDGRISRPGGDNYPVLIRKTEKKPIRVFLQDGENDLDNAHGSWPLANREMERALKFKGYDYRFVMGNGFHSDKHGRAILPDSLRWLWRTSTN